MRVLFWSFYNLLGTGGFEKQAMATAAALAEAGHEIACITTAAPPDAANVSAELANSGVFRLGVNVIPPPRTKLTWSKTLPFVFARNPSKLLGSADAPFLDGFTRLFRRLCDDLRIEWIYVLSLRSMYFLTGSEQPPILADLVDCYTLKSKRRLHYRWRYDRRRLLPELVDWLKTMRVESDIAARFRGKATFVFVSPADASYFRRLSSGADVRHVNCPVEAGPWFRSDENSASEDLLVLYGHLYTEFNYDAALRLIVEVFPRVVERWPTARLEVTGIQVPTTIAAAARAQRSVSVVHETDNIARFVRRAAVTCWPFRYGSGIKTKILESLLSGVPVVTTSRGAEPFTPRQRECLVIRDDTSGLATAVVELLGSPGRREELGKRGREMVLRDFTPAAKAQCVINVMQRKVGATRRATCEGEAQTLWREHGSNVEEQ